MRGSFFIIIFLFTEFWVKKLTKNYFAIKEKTSVWFFLKKQTRKKQQESSLSNDKISHSNETHTGTQLLHIQPSVMLTEP